jgi:hypothetical protein
VRLDEPLTGVAELHVRGRGDAVAPVGDVPHVEQVDLDQRPKKSA